MIAYQVPAVIRHLTPLQVIDEGVSSYTAVGIFALLASVGIPVGINMLLDLSLIGSSNIYEALTELQQLQLIESVQIATDVDSIVREVTAKFEEVQS